MIHHSVSYELVEQAGPPVPPLSFPKPRILQCHRKIIGVKNHQTGDFVKIKCIFVSVGDIDRAYVVKKTIAKSSSGLVRLCIPLKKKSATEPYSAAQWETTDELVVLKQTSYCKMRAKQKDPLKVAAALQYVGDYHPHVLGCEVIFQDADYLYIVTKYCAGGDLYLKMQRTLSIRGRSCLSPSELQARVWFRQLIQAISHLQTKGVCHLDISLENLLIDDHNNLQLVDFGSAYRVPYSSACNMGHVSDISDGSERRLISAPDQGGDLTYLAPEMVDRVPFDGFACDIWSAGIVLFILLVDMAPFQWAHLSDLRFQQIAQGRLKELLGSLKISVSDDACDLLQNMMMHDPSKRLNIKQITEHPWFTG
ncbi:hypothetical protein MPSEU_001064000 [Mayamaea pseudoterrestris]|nr:hypothetical protein MPSEU_001064000 [Mayamaea pseudoterrestris]